VLRLPCSRVRASRPPRSVAADLGRFLVSISETSRKGDPFRTTAAPGHAMIFGWGGSPSADGDDVARC
jgi:hypothetical protein